MATALILGVLMAVLLSACGSDPTPTPKPAAPPTATPAPDPDTVTEDFRAMIALGPFGAIAEGMRQMVETGTNGRITWTLQDISSGTGTVQNYIENRPEEYVRTIFSYGEESVLLAPKGISFGGEAPISPQPAGLFAIYPAACVTYLTTDPDVLTIADAAGRVLHSGAADSAFPGYTEMLLQAAGIRDETTVVVGGRRGEEGLADGEVDIFANGIIFPAGKNTYAALLPSLSQLANVTKELWMVDMTPELLEKAATETPTGKVWRDAGLLQPVTVYKGNIAKTVQAGYDLIRTPTITCAGGITVQLSTSPDADETTVYAMSRAMIEQRDMADELFPFISRAWKERLGHSWLPQANYHPGVVRAYEEAGLTYGVEGIRDWEAANQ